jgi:hypothetical protein
MLILGPRGHLASNHRGGPIYGPVLGTACTQVNLAWELRVTPQAVWAYLRRNPGVMVFLEQQVSAQDRHLLALIVRRHAMLAMQGQVASAAARQ